MKKIYIVLAIMAVAVFLRLWQLGQVPPSPDWDEAALGYNAYSIAQTGRDEYGQFLPIVLRSFDDYKPALYAYLTIPSITIFGLNTFAVRLPSAIFGILTVLATYFLLKELFKETKLKLEIKNLKLEIPEVAMLLLAISPWHLQFSRVAFEANVALAFNVFGAVFFLKAINYDTAQYHSKGRILFLVLSVCFFALSPYAYQSEKVFVPLLVLALVFIFKKELLGLPKKYLFLAVFAGLLISLPLLKYTFTDPQALTRARGVSAFADQTSFLQRSAQKLLHDREAGNWLGLVLDNRRVQYPLAAFSGYLSHFDPNWLFIKGDEARHHAPFMGLLYLWELPFLLIGIYSLIFGSFSLKTKLVVFSWFLLTPVPASITSSVPHAVRTLNFLPTFQIFTAIGLLTALGFISRYRISSIKHKALNIMFYTFFLILTTGNIAYYLNQYFVQQNYYYSYDWQYGYKELIDFLKPIHNNYRKIIISNRGNLSQSYMFFLFYLKYNPTKYLSEGGSLSEGFLERNSFSHFEFRTFNYYDEPGKVLFVGTDQDFPGAFKEIKRIYNLDGSLAIRVVEKE